MVTTFSVVLPHVPAEFWLSVSLGYEFVYFELVAGLHLKAHLYYLMGFETNQFCPAWAAEISCEIRSSFPKMTEFSLGTEL